jgi:lipopolysaccharide heptosyltransferase II
LRATQYDIAIDLQGLLKSGVWMGLAPARRKVGFNGTREGSHLFLTERVPIGCRDMHAVERYLSLVEAIGAIPSRVDFGLSVSEVARSRLRGMLRKEGWGPGTPYAVLVPGARWETKRWGAASFARMADRLQGTLGLHVAITGVPADRPLAAGILARMREPVLDLTGRTDLPALMALLAEAKVVVSTDSGPMHLAAALGRPAVCLFGPTAPWRTGPYGKGHRVIRAAVSCSPCFRRRCSHSICMGRIRPEEVEEAVMDVVKAKAKAEPQPWTRA